MWDLSVLAISLSTGDAVTHKSQGYIELPVQSSDVDVVGWLVKLSSHGFGKEI